MKTVSVKEMSRGGVSKVVREAEEEPVLVSRDNEPAVWMVSARDVIRLMERSIGSDPVSGAAALIAADLFDRGTASLGQAARLSGLSLADFIAFCDRIGVSVLRPPAEGVAAETDAFEQWLESASAPAS